MSARFLKQGVQNSLRFSKFSHHAFRAHTPHATQMRCFSKFTEFKNKVAEQMKESDPEYDAKMKKLKEMQERTEAQLKQMQEKVKKNFTSCY